MGGYETIEVPLPALITASSEIGNLRTASLLGIMAAQKKPLTIWNAQQLGIAQPPLKRTNLFKLFQPVRENNCQIIAADTPENAGVNLANSLRANRVL
jgi:electron transfer flavoprotein beta subunit